MDEDFNFYWEGNKKDIRIDVPGFGKDEINVKLSEDVLEISAFKKGKEVNSEEWSYREEQYSQSFSKKISLPKEISPDDYEVVVKDGFILLRKK